MPVCLRVQRGPRCQRLPTNLEEQALLPQTYQQPETYHSSQEEVPFQYSIFSCRQIDIPC